MMARKCLVILSLALTLTAGQAYAFDFWGVTVGSTIYDGADQLTFDGLATTDIEYVVGSYKYTGVDGTWFGPHAAAAPGEAYALHRQCDAMGLFFSADTDSMKFCVVTSSKQDGETAPGMGYGAREFGPGDLKIDVGGNTYGIGLRVDNLVWAVDPATTYPGFQIHKAEGGTDSIFARDAGTLGRVELGPAWDRVNHPSLPDYDPAAYAFFVKNSGSLVGSATVNYQNTGVSLEGYSVYAYEVTVPWATLGINPENYDFTASWRPDCGNDLLSLDCSKVPEPSAMLALVSGLVGLAGYRRRR